MPPPRRIPSASPKKCFSLFWGAPSKELVFRQKMQKIPSLHPPLHEIPLIHGKKNLFGEILVLLQKSAFHFFWGAPSKELVSRQKMPKNSSFGSSYPRNTLDSGWKNLFGEILVLPRKSFLTFLGEAQTKKLVSRQKDTMNSSSLFFYFSSIAHLKWKKSFLAGY